MFNLIGTTLFTTACLLLPITNWIESLSPSDVSKQIANMHGAQYSGTGYSDGTNLQWSEARIINGDAETYYYCHVELSDNGTRSVGFVVGIEVDYIANYKVTNIMNWIFGDIKTTSF